MHATLFPAILKAYGDRIRVIYRDYPLVEIHPWAMHAAIDANCLADQSNDAYWDFADNVHGSQKDISGHSRTEAFANLDRLAKEQGQKHNLDAGKLQACVQKQDESVVRASMADADKLGVDSTPTLYINGEKSTGVLQEDELKAMLDRALGQEKAPPHADAKK
jgi:protein-disulfide isomerase